MYRSVLLSQINEIQKLLTYAKENIDSSHARMSLKNQKVITHFDYKRAEKREFKGSRVDFSFV